MKTKIFIFLGILVIFLVSIATVFLLQSQKNDPFKSYKSSQIVIGAEPFTAYIADTVALQEQGLSGVVGLSENQAMLFVFDKPQILTFWMKDMLFPLDMIWLDNNYKIIGITENATPESYPKLFSPGILAQYVIEVNAGTSNRLGLKTGDSIYISNKLK